MEGIKEAIAYITGLAVKAEKPETIEINGRTYCTKDLRRYDAADKAEPIKATTLTSLVDYIKESREELRDRMIIQVVSATKVLLYSGLLAERDRETLFEVNALLPQFEYGREYDQESFLVAMQSCFQKTDDREAVTIMASNIVNTQQGTFSDDGVSQQAIIKTGVTTKDAAFVPNPVNLIPYRTFLEVPQPASDFVFRISAKEDKNMLIINIVLALVAALLLFGVIGEKDGLRQQNITIAFVAVIVLIIALNRFF